MKRPSGPCPADTERTPTHTHPLFPRPGITWTPLLHSSPVFPFGHRTPVPAAGSPGRRGFENHRPKTRSHIQNFSLFPLSTCVVYPQHTTHIRALASPLAITIALYLTYTRSCFRLFDYPFSDSWCKNLWNPAPDFLEFTLYRFGELTIIR